MKIVITGGHHNSALVIAEALRSKGYDVIWVGHKYTMVDDPHISLEYQEVTNKQFPFYYLPAGKFHPQAHFIHWFRLPWGFLHALWLLAKIKPQLVLTFGGYIAVPVAIAAKLYRIPILAFEQTVAIGRANKVISQISHQNFLAWASSAAYFPTSKSQVVGLPMRSISDQTLSWFKRSRPIIVVTGGKQGSHAINQAFFPLIDQLIADYNIIHQTGGVIKTSDLITAAKIKAALPKSLRPFYLWKPHFSSEMMLRALKTSNLVISRAGAHTVYELHVLKKPAILIPLPFSYLNEQYLNAQKLATIGQANIISQRDLNPQTLLQAIRSSSKLKTTQTQTLPTNATQIIIEYINQYYPHVAST